MLVYEGWCLWLPLCGAHLDLFDEDVACELKSGRAECLSRFFEQFELVAGAKNRFRALTISSVARRFTAMQMTRSVLRSSSTTANVAAEAVFCATKRMPSLYPASLNANLGAEDGG